MIATGLIAGLALCLTPCVFPMIPITVSYFSTQSSENTAGRLGLGFMYTVGIALTYGVIGGLMGAGGRAIGDLFKMGWFNIVLALILIGLALSMFGLYEIRLPSFIQKNLKSRSGAVGALIMGLLMGFAAAPCAGALLTALALQVANTGSPVVGITVFTAVGLGLGLPFMALAVFSSSIGALPRPGSWLTAVKALMGFVVLGLSLNYLIPGLGIALESTTSYYIWIATLAGFLVYLFFFDQSNPSKSVVAIKGIGGAAIGILLGFNILNLQEANFKNELNEKLGNTAGGLVEPEWEEWNDESFEAALASGKPIMIDATANWCAKCHEIEDNVLNTPGGLIALQGVHTMKIDWSTGVDPEYEKKTRERFGIIGLPHLIFVTPGGDEEFAVQELKSVEDLEKQLKKAGKKF